MEFIMTFGSTHGALKAETVLKRSGVPFRLLPAPKPLAEHCALVISVEAPELDRATRVLTDAGTSPREVYRKDGGELVKV